MASKTLQSPGIGTVVMIGAGLCAAVLFTVARQNNPAAMALAFFAPLPIMISTLGFGPMIGLGAAGLGTLTAAILAAVHQSAGPETQLAIGLSAAAVFAVTRALPAWWLAFVSCLVRAEGARRWRIQNTDRKTPQLLVFYPIGHILLHAAAIVIGLAGLATGAVALGFHGFDATIAKVSESVRSLVAKLVEMHPELPGDLGVSDLAGLALKTMPMMIAAFVLLMLLANLWLAGRIVLTSNRLPRRWPDIAHELRMPRLLVLALGGAIGLSLMKGWPHTFGLIATVTLGLVYALQGIAVVHDLSRGSRWRGSLLFIVYTSLILLAPWPLAPLALIGLADTAFSLRDRKAAALLASKP